jgi:predicted Fe-S protein YdhL (DUF1289 family)
MTRNPSASRAIRTPCIGVCSTGIGDAVCRGCKRFAYEVIDWNGYTQEEKRIVDGRLSQFLATCVAHNFRIVDEKLLRWQLEVQQIQFNPDHDQYCWLFALLKAGASQIDDSLQYGFQRQDRVAGQSLVALREVIDQEFWELSVGHYERYHATPDLFSVSN